MTKQERAIRDEQIANNYLHGVTIQNLMEKFDMSRTGIRLSLTRSGAITPLTTNAREYRNSLIRDEYTKGCSAKELSDKYLISEGAIYVICEGLTNPNNKEYSAILQDNSDKIIELLNYGVGKKEIADLFNTDRHAVYRFAKSHNLSVKIHKNSEEDAAQKIKDKSNGVLEYISGYTIKENPVKVRCMVCGGEFERTFHSITSKGHTNCPHCLKREREQNRNERQTKTQNKAIQDQKKKAERFSRSQLISMRECVECGELFIPKNKNNIRCSSACIRRALNRNADARLNENNIVDKDITLTKLYKRDEGVCYLCGRKCNWNDSVSRSNGVVIVGDDYPSIEHVVPLSKGGKHCWDNVRLACRGCNTKKSAKILKAYPLP